MKIKTSEENKIITSSQMLTGDYEVVNVAPKGVHQGGASSSSSPSVAEDINTEGKTQIISDGRDSDCLLDNCLDNPEQSEVNLK